MRGNARNVGVSVLIVGLGGWGGGGGGGGVLQMELSCLRPGCCVWRGHC